MAHELSGERQRVAARGAAGRAEGRAKPGAVSLKAYGGNVAGGK